MIEKFKVKVREIDICKVLKDNILFRLIYRETLYTLMGLQQYYQKICTKRREFKALRS